MQQAGHGLIAQRRYRRRLQPTEGEAYRSILPPFGLLPVIPFNARRAAGRNHPWNEAMRQPLSPEAIENFLNPPSTTPTPNE